MPLPYVPPFIGPNGIVINDYATILQYLLSNYTATYGSSVYLGVDSSDYQDVAIRALQAADVNSLAQAVALSFNLQFAIGISLDLLGKLVGTARRQSSSSTVLLTLTGTVGAVITNGIAQDTNGNFWNLPSSVTIGSGGTATAIAVAQNLGNITANPGTIILISTPTAGWTAVTNAAAATPGQAVEPDSSYRARLLVAQAKPSLSLRAGTAAAVAAVPGVTRSVVYENPNGFTASYGLCNTSGTGVTQLFGYPFDSTDATQPITITTTTAIGTVSVGASGGTLYVVNDVLGVVQSGGALGQVKVTTVSGGGVVTGLVVVAADPGAGYSVANNLATTGGTGTGCQVDILSLATAALIYSISSVGSSTTLTLGISAGTQTNVAYAIGGGISLGPPHSITAVVEGGTTTNIAQSIYNNKNPGVLTNGTTTVTVTDPLNGNISMPISFDILGYVEIYVALNVHGLTGFSSAVQANIATDVLTYLDSLGIGESVVFSQLYGAALQAQPNPLVPIFSIYSIISGSAVAPPTSSTLTATNPVIVVTSNTGIANGQVAVGTGIPANTTVTNVSGTNITLSAAPTASGTQPVTFFACSTIDIPISFFQAPSSATSQIVVNLV